MWLKFFLNRKKCVRINFEDGGEIDEIRIVKVGLFTATGYTIDMKGEDANLIHINISRVQVLTELGKARGVK